MIYKIRAELEEGVKLLGEAEDALKAGSLDAAKLSRLEQLSSATDAMLILRKQAAYRERFETVFKGMDDYKARHPLQAAPAIAEITGDYILLKNILCVDADGVAREQHQTLRVRKDIERNPDGSIMILKPYDAEAHLEQKGRHLPSFPLSCNIVLAFYRERADREIAKALQQYKNKGNGNGWHCQGSLVAWGRGAIINYPNDADFPSHGGNSGINAGRRYELLFEREGLKDMPVADVIKGNNKNMKRFVQQFSCIPKLEEFLELGQHLGKIPYVWVSSSNKTRAAWLGCGGDGFNLDANYDLYYDIAARGVRASP